MTTSRQPELLLRALAAGYPAGALLERHSHSWAQLVYASQGVMRVETDAGVWVVPSHRAVWIPAETPHSVAMSGRVAMRSLYLVPELAGELPQRCGVIAVPPLLRELVLLAVARAPLRGAVAEDRRLAEFLHDQLRVIPTVPLALPMPRDPRAVRLAQRLRSEPGNLAPLEELARGSGASRRTLERLFCDETGLSLGRWRQQARMLHALELLAGDEPVTSVAHDVGYESPSAFIAAFSEAFGTTPGRYYRAPKIASA